MPRTELESVHSNLTDRWTERQDKMTQEGERGGN